MPESWRQGGGYRPDLLQAIAGLRPPVIRWPGGCFRFVLPLEGRHRTAAQTRATPDDTIWDDKEVNSFGTDEFVAMCRRVGAEPLIVVNIGTPQWNRGVMDNDFLQEALDWIEYCNGPADSKWGKIRAANGHPEPYRVKYWEIDNETWHMGAETYAEWVHRFAPAMRKADPSIKLAACGSGGYGNGRNGLAWNRVLIEQCADKIDYLSIHHYENPNHYAEGPRAYEQFFRKTGELIAASKNPKLKIYVSEWNAQSTDWRTGLYCGGLLNAFERCGDVLEIGGPASVPAPRFGQRLGQRVCKLRPSHLVPGAQLCGHEAVARALRPATDRPGGPDGPAQRRGDQVGGRQDAAGQSSQSVGCGGAGGLEAGRYVRRQSNAASSCSRHAGGPQHAGRPRCHPAQTGHRAAARFNATVHACRRFPAGLWRFAANELSIELCIVNERGRPTGGRLRWPPALLLVFNDYATINKYSN